MPAWLRWPSPFLRVALYAALTWPGLILPMYFARAPGGPCIGVADCQAMDTIRATNAIVGGTVVALVLMAIAWARRFSGAWDAVGVLGAWTCAFMGYMVQPPNAWLLLPVFLAPWALLFVELAPRHRVLLLGMQWLTSIKFLEALTATTVDTLVIAGLGVLHLVLVWVSLRGSPLGRVPLLVGLAIGGVGAAAALAFLVVQPTPQRALALVPPAALILAVGLLAKGKLLAGSRLPVLLRSPLGERQADR